MKKRQKEIERVYEEQWAGGKGSHHPDYDPEAAGDDVVKASRETEVCLRKDSLEDISMRERSYYRSPAAKQGATQAWPPPSSGSTRTAYPPHPPTPHPHPPTHPFRSYTMR
jgi:hypothetical protein